MKKFKLIILYIITVFYGCSNNNGNEKASSDNSKESDRVNIDICKCLTEPGNSDYLQKNSQACDEAISKEIGVADWKKVNMSTNKTVSDKFDELANRCADNKPNQTSTVNCYGNESCISKIRENFSNTGKTILGEEYLGNGKFGISFMDAQHGDAYNATVTTDCNCNVTNVNVSTIR